MKKYIIVAETGSDIPSDVAKKYGIYFVPMHVTFGEETKDDRTFSPAEVCDYYKETGKIPKTSGCNPADFEKVFNEVFKTYPECYIVYVAYSAVTTCSYQSAKVAAEDNPNITFIDTKQVTIGQGAVVIRLARELQKHPEWTIKEIEETALQISNAVRMCFVPSNMDYLKAGGRVSNAAALCGNLLNIHPRIEVLDGYLKATKKYRGKMRKVVLTLLHEYIAEQNLDREEIWLGSTIGFSEELKGEAIKAVRELGFEKVNWFTAGGVITTHGGPEAFCMAGFVGV